MSQTLPCIDTPTFPKPSHSSYLPANEDGTECSETSAYKIQTPENDPEEIIQPHKMLERTALPLFFELLFVVLVTERQDTLTVILKKPRVV